MRPAADGRAGRSVPTGKNKRSSRVRVSRPFGTRSITGRTIEILFPYKSSLGPEPECGRRSAAATAGNHYGNSRRTTIIQHCDCKFCKG